MNLIPIQISPADPGWVVTVEESDLRLRATYAVAGWTLLRDHEKHGAPNLIAPFVCLNGQMVEVGPEFASPSMDVTTKFDEGAYERALASGGRLVESLTPEARGGAA